MQMMARDLERIRHRFRWLTVATFLLTPVAGLWAALTFGLTDLREAHAALADGIVPAFLLLMLAWVFMHFGRYLDPIFAWLRTSSAGTAAPAPLRRRLMQFTRDYWAVYLCYALVVPWLYYHSTRAHVEAAALAQLVLVQLAVAVLAALPAYLLALDRLGQLVAYLGLGEVHVSIKSKLRVGGGLVPLLAYSLLMHYFWVHTGYLSGEVLAVWGALALVTVTVTLVSIRSMRRALRPVQDVLQRSGASTHSELAGVRPQSTDEIGYLTQMLGRLFRRLSDQEAHVRAVVDNAAEGIIVIDEQGNIDTFNAAAERLFGYRAQEIRGRPLVWLIPALTTDTGNADSAWAEQELEGLHRDGTPIPIAARVSEMRISDKRMFSCLVADISARKAAERKLMEAEKRYRDLVETAHDLVWSIDDEGRWTYLNEASRTIYGLAPEEMIGRSITEFHAPEYAQRDAAAFDDIRQGKELVQYETVHLARDGTPRQLSFNARALTDAEGRITRISGTARDITDQKAVERRLAYQAEHDSLTGLFNRHYFQQELERVVARIARGGTTCAVFYIDLDQFKYINDTLGHAAGDRLLIEISTLLAQHVRESDLLARFGGDEFTVLLYDIDAQHVLQAAEHFRALFDQYKFFEAGNAFNVSCSIGAALIDSEIRSADEALSHADIACNIAKSRGRNCANLYNPADRDKAGMAEDMGWAARVREMLEHDRFQLVYQPIVSVDDGRVQDYEVLMRMVCDDGQIILPGGFMPAAERFGLIHGVDRWTVRRAIRQLAQMHADGNPVRFAINLSGRAFEDSTLLPLIDALLRETGLDPAALTFEITETAAIANLQAAGRFIRALKDIGCQFALDDFGSGFCSFTYLKHLPVDKLKIDGSFVQSMAHAPVDQAMVQSMNQVAHALGKHTIAEYVENARTLELLKSYGVDFAQGNFIGKPQSTVAGTVAGAARPLLQ